MADGMGAPEAPLYFDGSMYRSVDDEKQDEKEHNKVMTTWATVCILF